MQYVLGIDVGGTFTDAVAADEQGRVVGAKTPSTPSDYADGVLNAISELAETLGISEAELLANTAYIAHGTTSTLNALVTGNVNGVGFITTKGHGDSIAIMNVEGRYLGLSGSEAQDLINTRKPAPLVPRTKVMEVTERVDQGGTILVHLNEDEVRAAVRELVDSGIDAIAVSLLWSFQNPAHERRIRQIINEVAPDVFVSISSEVSPRIREFSRSSTTIMNTQLGPPLKRYLEPLSAELKRRGVAGPLLIMQSSGGTVSSAEAPASAITTVGSVLSGGVVGASRLAAQLGHRNVITADVGGTTFLVGLVVDGEPVRAAGTIINQHPINVPTIKVDVIGSGGGAIAWIDAGWNLRVGPKSAAAVPGPAAYGHGGIHPTVTDADLVLGIINPDYFLGGKRALRVDLAEKALLENIGNPLGLNAREAAAAVYEVQNAQTADLMRKSVVESGNDPRDFVVYAFGGAGPIHASAFSMELGAKELVIPLGAAASGFSAYGLAASDVIVSAELSDPSPFPVSPDRVNENFRTLASQVSDALDRQGVEFESLSLTREFDARYTAQMFEVIAPAPPEDIDESGIGLMTESFERRYAELYGEGSGLPAAGLQIITYRVRGVGRLPFRPTLPEHLRADSSNAQEAIKGHRQVFLQVERGFEETAIYDYGLLRAGHRIQGPAVVEVPTTTVTIPAGYEAHIDALGNIRIPLDTHA
ncbi:hydantoinase/oxoprolinase family protein [Gordonia sp. L191]|uniref:hydantoinase/oxoprolinase family protein n=1 Tax=Gordonia sp. L191 TaxID=2982699 RepID=UPI0024C0CDB9|nr:hydantoinase/oxoprolinase family protein [Gordonia sp. L191]WHU46517.1 hydantoinase/oxoprolinase family protein [Gordonia sp. L191]